MPAPLPANVTAAQMQAIADDLRAYAVSLNLDPAVVVPLIEDELANVAKGGQPPDWVAVRARIKGRADAKAETPPPTGFTWERETLLVNPGLIRERRRAVGPWETVSERPV